jgi:plastocyanin
MALIAAVGLLALVAGLFAMHTSARAASPSVGVGTPENRFTPNISNITVGDTVTFSWSAGVHIVDLKDVSPDLQIDSSHTSGVTSAFSTPGTYYYYCSVHSSEAQATEAHVQANDAMVGKIVVTAASSGAGANPTAPAAPSTGSGFGSSESLMGLWLVAGGIALVAVSGAIVAFRHR